MITKDISPYCTNLTSLCSAGGKLYFVNRSAYPVSLWSSEGDEASTQQVNDAVVNGLFHFSHLTAAGKTNYFLEDIPNNMEPNCMKAMQALKHL